LGIHLATLENKYLGWNEIWKYLMLETSVKSCKLTRSTIILMIVFFWNWLIISVLYTKVVKNLISDQDPIGKEELSESR